MLPCPLCRHDELPPLRVPVIAFEGGQDFTIPTGYMAQVRCCCLA